MGVLRLDADVVSILNARQARMKNKSRPLPKPPRIQPPLAVERDYQRDLLKMTHRLKEYVHALLIPHLERLVRDANLMKPQVLTSPIRQDAWTDDLNSFMSAVRLNFFRDYSDREIKFFADKAGMSVNDYSIKKQDQIMKRVLGTEVLSSEPWLKDQLSSFVISNTKLIQSIPDRTLQEIEGIAFRGISTGTRAEELAAEIEDRFSVSDSRARLIARDQVAKLNGQLDQLRQTNVGVEQYTWRTSLDERVRDSHREKEGKVFDWNDPPADTGHPGEDFQCRCYAEPVFQGSIE